MPIAQFFFATLLLLASGLTSGNDESTTPPPSPSAGAIGQKHSGDSDNQDESSTLLSSGTWRVVPSVSQSKSTTSKVRLPASITINWPALDEAEIDSVREETTSRALITGQHRDIPPGHQGNLLEDLNWTNSGSHKQAHIQLTAEGADSIRVQFRVSLPPGSSLSFLGTQSGEWGSPPVWSQSVLAARQADSTAIWSPSGQAGALGIVVDVPTSVSLIGHFLIFEKISHRWGSTPTSSSLRKVTPKHGDGSLSCPLHYVDTACNTSDFPSDSNQFDLQGAVVHIHYESGAFSFGCSGSMLSQKEVSQDRLRDFLLTAHHCINTREEADSIESAHYLAASRCGGLLQDRRVFWTYGGADYITGLHSADQTLVELRGPFPNAYWLSGWDANSDAPYQTAVYGLHHPRGRWMAFSKGFASDRRDISVQDYGRVLDAIPTAYFIGTTEPGSSGSGLFYDSEEGYLVGVLSAGNDCNDPSLYGSFRDFFPVIRRYIDPGGVEDPIKLVGRVPYFPRDRLSSQQGFILAINSSDGAATVIVRTSSETSSSFAQACRFQIPARSTRALNSQDLEIGNASKGCSGSGRGNGDWTLEFLADVPSLDLYVYARALDGSGFLNSLAGTAKEIEADEGYWYFLPIVNPASNLSSRSTVRITNLGPEWARDVQLFGYDAEGFEFPASGATFLARALAPNQTVSFTSQDLEYGNAAKLHGSAFGEGSGKWKLWIFSPKAPLEVTGLMASRGLTSNLSR